MANGDLIGGKTGYKFEYNGSNRHTVKPKENPTHRAVVDMVDEWLAMADLGVDSPWLQDPNKNVIRSDSLTLTWKFEAYKPGVKASAETFGVGIKAKEINQSNSIRVLVQTGNNSTRRRIELVFPFQLVDQTILSKEYFRDRLYEAIGQTNERLRAIRDKRSLREEEGEEMPQLVTEKTLSRYREVLFGLTQRSKEVDCAIRLADYHDETLTRFRLNRGQSLSTLGSLESLGIIERGKGALKMNTSRIYYNLKPQSAESEETTRSLDEPPSLGSGSVPVISSPTVPEPNSLAGADGSAKAGILNVDSEELVALVLYDLKKVLAAKGDTLDGEQYLSTKIARLTLSESTGEPENIIGWSIARLIKADYLQVIGEKTAPVGYGLTIKSNDLLAKSGLGEDTVAEPSEDPTEREPVSVLVEPAQVVASLLDEKPTKTKGELAHQLALRLNEEWLLAHRQLPMARAEVERLEEILEDENHRRAVSYIAWLESLTP